MTYFITLLGAYIIILSAVNIQIQKYQNEDVDLSFKNYLKSLDTLYNIGFGGWGDSNSLNIPSYFLFLVNTVLIPLIMFNLLIAIISETFANYNEGRELYDMRQLVDILVDWNYFVTTFYRSN